MFDDPLIPLWKSRNIMWGWNMLLNANCKQFVYYISYLDKKISDIGIGLEIL